MICAQIGSAIETRTAFHVGPLPVSETVVVTWGIMAVLAGISFAATRRLEMKPGALQNFLEMVVEWIEGTVRQIVHEDPAPYIPLVGTLFIFVITANLAPTFVPMANSPTADIATTSALALIVFVSVPFFGIRARGLAGYLKTFLQPIFIMLPFNVIGEISRTIALAVRLFGNMMSGQLIFAVVLALAPIVAPVAAIPFQMLGLLTGTIQAYVFTILTIVFIGGAVESRRRRIEHHPAKQEVE